MLIAEFLAGSLRRRFFPVISLPFENQTILQAASSNDVGMLEFCSPSN